MLKPNISTPDDSDISTPDVETKSNGDTQTTAMELPSYYQTMKSYVHRYPASPMF